MVYVVHMIAPVLSALKSVYDRLTFFRLNDGNFRNTGN